MDKLEIFRILLKNNEEEKLFWDTYKTDIEGLKKSCKSFELKEFSRKLSMDKNLEIIFFFLTYNLTNNYYYLSYYFGDIVKDDYFFEDNVPQEVSLNEFDNMEELNNYMEMQNALCVEADALYVKIKELSDKEYVDFEEIVDFVKKYNGLTIREKFNLSNPKNIDFSLNF